MNNNSAIISIVTPVKGRVDLFRQTFDSVVRQNCVSWEWIIIDDGSAEEEFQEIKDICASDERIMLLKRDDNGCGASYCRNYGAKESHCEWIVFLDADDILKESFIENRVSDIDKNPGVDFFAYRTLMFYDNPGDSDLLWNDFTSENDLRRFLRVDTPWQTTGVLWHKDFFKRVGGFDADCKNWQDWEIHVRALALNPRYLKIKREIDFYYRKSNRSQISTQNAQTEFLLDRISTIDKIINVLHESGKLDKESKYYVAKILVNIEVNLRNIGLNNCAIGHIQANRLLRPLAFRMWKWYIDNNLYETSGLTPVRKLQKKCFDKIVYLKHKDHFADTKTSFMTVKYKED